MRDTQTLSEARKLKIPRHGSTIVNLLGTLVLYLPVVAVLLHSVGNAATPDPGNYQQLIMQAEAIPKLIEDKLLTKFEIPNPHWNKDACLACHVGEPDGPGSLLKAPSDASCFFCHSESSHVDIHPVNLAPGKKMLARMPKAFKKNLAKGDNTTCITCHDVILQCTRGTTAARLHNRTFIRGGTYRSRTGFCYQCHDKAAYKKQNAHDQISDAGIVNEDKCLVCHKSVPKQNINSDATDTALQTDSNWSEICLNCHKWEPHPGGNMNFFSTNKKPPDHLVVPSSKIFKHMAKITKKSNIDMPLEPGTGKIYCATCHNPHERGVIKKVSSAKGADEKGRLRSSSICLICHDK